MKKSILVSALCLCFSLSYAQLKVMGGGRVGIGTNDVSGSKLHVSTGPGLTPQIISTSGQQWSYGLRARTSTPNVKLFAAGTLAADNFVVLTNGMVHYSNFWV